MLIRETSLKDTQRDLKDSPEHSGRPTGALSEMNQSIPGISQTNVNQGKIPQRHPGLFKSTLGDHWSGVGATQGISKALWEIQWISEDALEMPWVSPTPLQWISQSAFEKPWVSLRDFSLVNIGLGDSWDALSLCSLYCL